MVRPVSLKNVDPASLMASFKVQVKNAKKAVISSDLLGKAEVTVVEKKDGKQKIAFNKAAKKLLKQEGIKSKNAKKELEPIFVRCSEQIKAFKAEHGHKKIR